MVVFIMYAGEVRFHLRKRREQQPFEVNWASIDLDYTRHTIQNHFSVLFWPEQKHFLNLKFLSTDYIMTELSIPVNCS